MPQAGFEPPRPLLKRPDTICTLDRATGLW